jgi:hypothetical protein
MTLLPLVAPDFSSGINIAFALILLTNPRSIVAYTGL